MKAMVDIIHAIIASFVALGRNWDGAMDRSRLKNRPRLSIVLKRDDNLHNNRLTNGCIDDSSHVLINSAVFDGNLFASSCSDKVIFTCVRLQRASTFSYFCSRDVTREDFDFFFSSRLIAEDINCCHWQRAQNDIYVECQPSPLWCVWQMMNVCRYRYTGRLLRHCRRLEFDFIPNLKRRHGRFREDLP